jgi:hypothetical protein
LREKEVRLKEIELEESKKHRIENKRWREMELEERKKNLIEIND